MRKLILLAILLLCAATARGQATTDCFGGLLTYSDGSAAPTISGHPDVQNATISQSGTTQTAIVADATKFAVNEPIFVKGTSTAMDYSCDTTRSDAGASLITAINTGTNTLTLTAPASRTQSGVSGTITPAHEWVPSSPVSLGGKQRIPFVTPLDHWRFQEEVGAACAGSTNDCPGLTVLTAKYGNSKCTMAFDVYSQLKVLNFNGITNNSDGEYDPTGNGACSNVKGPYSQEQFVSSYASVDLGGYATQPLINTTYGLTVTLNGPKRALLDYFNPQFQSFMTSFLPNFNNSFTAFAKSPWFGKVTVDDTGNVALTNATWNFHTMGNTSANDNNPAYQILVSAPLQAGNNTNNAIYGGGPAKPYLYKDPTVYSKTPCSYNPYGTSTTCTAPTTCDMLTPCRLADYLCCGSQSKYSSLANMNAAGWPLYTTMGSSETPHLAETVATGNGATTVFTGTLANSNVTPTSVQLYLTPSGGSPVFFGFGCWNSLINCGGSAGQSVWKSAGVFVGSVAYPLHYVLTDSNGDIEEVTTAGTTASSAPSWPAAGSCTGTQTTVSGTATFTCRGSSVSAGNVVDSTGVFTLTTNNALATGATISVNYTTGGWKASTPGTGFVDTDGSNTSIFGTNSVCSRILPNWTAGTTYGYGAGQTYEIHDVISGTWQIVVQAGISGGGAPAFSTTTGTDVTDGTVIWESVGKPVCGTESGSTFGIANMNQTVAADLDGWLPQDGAQYLKSVRTSVKTIAPHLLYQGPDQCGVWFNPCRREIAQAMQLYSDVYYTTLADPSFDPNGTAKYKFITADYNGPIYLYTTYSTTQNAITTANCKDNYPCYATQAARGTGWYNLLNWSINQTPGLSGIYQLAGLLHWGTHNFQTSPFGLRSDLDNQYDGLEDVVAPLACSIPLSLLTCGGESALANFLGANGLTGTHSYKDANALWFTFLSQVAPSRTTFTLYRPLPEPSNLVDTLTARDAQ